VSRRAFTAAALALLFALSGCGAAVLPAASPTPAPTPAPAASPDPTSVPSPSPPEDGELVTVTDWIPDIYVDLKYAGTDNFTGKAIYDFTAASLRYGTVKKLAAAQSELKAQGLSLKIWDAYRPVSAQFRLWDICPDPTYVADPTKGFSKHSRGNTVDVTLVNADGSEIEMPSGFDDFTGRADRDYSDVSAAAGADAELLDKVMTKNGFAGYSGEWWHYSDVTVYPVIEK
jgi:D-alanyl-D-alanine dipeptidase